ncbi:U-box domain-containing protein 33-like isoform X2 [Nymphaea colorata]|uniref:U-box domain-containing protein 33-like isoform X2 n=1 Tax=Nymphaea colorata TaxID=210225 RepID=UPI00214EAFAC|nr:U-box domain-containing protein 33-like isoform X2 [Nymphaea colorata]
MDLPAVPKPRVGKLPASQASPEALLAYRIEEKEEMKKTLCNYLNICRRAKVKATAVVIEATQVQFGLVDMVVHYGIRTLIMGAASESCLKANSSSKAQYAVKNAPLFCEIWFICKGKSIRTRKATQVFEPAQSIDPEGSTKGERLRSRSLPCQKEMIEFNPRYTQSNSCKSEPSIGITSEACGNNLSYLKPVKKVIEKIDSFLVRSSYFSSHTSHTSGSNCEEYIELELLTGTIIEAKTEAAKSSNDALSEERKIEVNHAKEKELQEAEDKLRKTEFELGKLLKQREEITGEMQKAKRVIASLDSQTGDSKPLLGETTGKLASLQVSLADLRRQINSVRKLRDETIQKIQLWHDSGDFDGSFSPQANDFSEYTLLDIQTATCSFSESFKLGQGGHGCVYKGEISGRTVAIKNFHPEDMYSILEFQQEVKVLSKIRHPNLLILLGACPEALSLVYEYMPKGSLQRYLTHSLNTTPLTWRIRTKIASQIASALLFLHSSKPEKIVHGDLKPENILLKSDFTCKIGDFGISRLLPEQNSESRIIFQNTEPKCSFAYMDPETQRTGSPTPESDVYAFGIVVLQLVTGRQPQGLARKVRHASACGKLEEFLDVSAGEWPMRSATRMIELGLRCCELNRRDRLKLSPEVVQELEKMV